MRGPRGRAPPRQPSTSAANGATAFSLRRWPPSPRRSPRSSPPTSSSASCATSASTPSRVATADAVAEHAGPARPRRGCSSTSSPRRGSTTPTLDDNGYVMATLPATIGDDAPAVGLIAHVDTSPDAPGAGVEPIVHRAYDGGRSRCPRGGTVLDPERMPELARQGRPRHRHLQRRHAARRRRQGRRRGDHGRGRVPRRAPRAAAARRCASASRPTRRSARARRCSTSSASARAAPTRMDGSTVGELQDETFTAAEVIVTIEGVEVHPGLRHRQARQRRAARRRGSLARAARRTSRPRRPRGREGFIHPYELTRHRGARDDPRDRARLRRRPARAARRRCCAATAEEIVAGEPRATARRSRSAAVPEHAPLPRPVPRGRRRRPSARSGAEGIEPRARRRSAAAPTARGSARWACRRRTSSPAATSSTRVREWASVQDMAAAAATIVRLAEVWADR